MDDYIVLDTETTGLRAKEHRLIEVAAIRVANGHSFTYFHTLINPERPIPPEASAIHHVTDAMVQRAPRWTEVRAALDEFIGDRPVIAHNAEFDRSFLPEFHARTWVCNCRFARRVWPDAPKHSNQGLRYWLNLATDVHQAHRALDDARVTAAIFAHGLSELRARGHGTDLLAVQSFISARSALVTMPFGKHRGTALAEVPESYLTWALESAIGDADLQSAIEQEQARRAVAGPATMES